MSLMVARLGLVFTGGLVGSAIRHLMTSGGGHWTVFVVNVAGALLAGYLVGRVPAHSHRSQVLLPLAVIGVAGAVTTFSGLVVDTIVLLDSGAIAEAVALGGVSLAIGPAAAAIGLWTGRRV